MIDGGKAAEVFVLPSSGTTGVLIVGDGRAMKGVERGSHRVLGGVRRSSRSNCEMTDWPALPETLANLAERLMKIHRRATCFSRSGLVCTVTCVASVVFRCGRCVARIPQARWLEVRLASVLVCSEVPPSLSMWSRSYISLLVVGPLYRPIQRHCLKNAVMMCRCANVSSIFCNGFDVWTHFTSCPTGVTGTAHTDGVGNNSYRRPINCLFGSVVGAKRTIPTSIRLAGGSGPNTVTSWRTSAW